MELTQKIYGYIYKITFPENSFRKNGIPYYIGQKLGTPENTHSYYGSGRKVVDWFKKRGYSSRNISAEVAKNLGISKEILEIIYFKNELSEKDLQLQLNEAERKYIEPHLNECLCLNLANGGDSPFCADELKKRISEKTKEAMWRDDVREKYLKALPTRFTEETKQKISKKAKERVKNGDRSYIKANKEAIKALAIKWNEKNHEESRKRLAAAIGKKVRCIETNEVFDSMHHAEEVLHIFHIIRACKDPNKTAGGLHWEFYNNDKEK